MSDVEDVMNVLAHSSVTIGPDVITIPWSCEQFFAFIVARFLVGLYGWSKDSQRKGSPLL